MKGIVIDEIGQVEDAFVSTAIDAYSLKNVAEDEMFLHLFQHQGINMGVDDVRMNDFDKGLDFYRAHDLPVTIRNSGGRSIVADEGVLNMSLIFHTSKSMNENYQFYGDFIRDALKPISNEIEIYKVEGAYCPGDTDMSIKGQKFCGTAQRRSGSRTSMVCYISVCGDQLRRGELVRNFYSQCHGDVVNVNPHAMQSLDILTGFALTPRYIGDLLIHALAQYCESVEGRKLEDLDVQGFQEAKDRTREHNQRLLP